jgi:carboxypeptidase family protein/TonB-dependent receptor-like protein
VSRCPGAPRAAPCSRHTSGAIPQPNEDLLLNRLFPARAARCTRLLMLLLGVLSAAAPLAAQQAAAPRGRVAGRVVDAQSGQPIAGVQIEIVGQTNGAQTDLDGRYRTGTLPAGRYTVRARRIGLRPVQYDSIAITTEQTATVNFSLSQAAVSLAGVTISGETATRTSSTAALLGIQQKAAVSMDGVSAEQIRKTPDSDASAAAQRVSGVSVVDNKFVVVRGLAERYSNTMLNGTEIASPEPAKKIVPLDLFPAGLIEAIVVSKSATPDKPGDFSGGSVEIRTKEFPENPVRQFSLGFGYNANATFKQAQIPVFAGLDYLGFNNGRRAQPAVPEEFENAGALEHFAESVRTTWSPPLRSVLPNLKFDATIGGETERLGSMGYLMSLTYSTSSEFTPDRTTLVYSDPHADPVRGFTYTDQRAVVDWGAIANFAWKPGGRSKIALKNLYTRNAEELYSEAQGFNTDRNGELRGYQFLYVERDLLQSQLTGDHLVQFVFPSRVEWKATMGLSRRNEPDNRQLLYLRAPAEADFRLGSSNDFWFRTLKDRNLAGQVDWSIPFGLWDPSDANLKVGSLYRTKTRAFESLVGSFRPAAGKVPNDILALPPEQLFVPELLGNGINVDFQGGFGQPYDADDQLTAFYAMADLPLFRGLRVVGGARLEKWALDLFDGGRGAASQGNETPPTVRRNNDLLWSVNATYAIGARMNLRAAAFRSVARPDTRELSRDLYTDVVGNCPTVGNPGLQRSLVLNGELRWEFYPDAGEVVALSVFGKDIAAPIVRIVVGDNGCTFTYNNAQKATNIGGEVDIRKALRFLPGPLSQLTMGLNVTYVDTRVTIDPRFGVYNEDLPLEGQSPYLVNSSLSYAGENGGPSVSVLFSYFDDRVARYGFRSAGGAGGTQGPNLVEQGRGQLDLKVQQAIRADLTVSLSARNLTDNAVIFTQDVAAGQVRTGYYRPGRSISLTFGLDR